jgi:hypothetical protein
MYLWRLSEASPRYCSIPGGNPPRSRVSRELARGSILNPGLLHSNQVPYHWATWSPIFYNFFCPVPILHAGYASCMATLRPRPCLGAQQDNHPPPHPFSPNRTGIIPPPPTPTSRKRNSCEGEPEEAVSDGFILPSLWYAPLLSQSKHWRLQGEYCLYFHRQYRTSYQNKDYINSK